MLLLPIKLHFLCYPISSTETRILIDFPGDTPPKKSPELTAYLTETIGGAIPEGMQSSFLNAVEEGKFKVMPNHRLSANPVTKTGAVVIGDALNMRHPLTGGGMTAAFTDILNLGERLAKVSNWSEPDEVNHAVMGFYDSRHRGNATINILADALYGVLKHPDLKQACYDYLNRGGSYANEPIAILSAISRDRQLLINHFFAVARYGAAKILKPYPTPAKNSPGLSHDARCGKDRFSANQK